jgi:hypothetical protein
VASGARLRERRRSGDERPRLALSAPRRHVSRRICGASRSSRMRVAVWWRTSGPSAAVMSSRSSSRASTEPGPSARAGDASATELLDRVEAELRRVLAPASEWNQAEAERLAQNTAPARHPARTRAHFRHPAQRLSRRDRGPTRTDRPFGITLQTEGAHRDVRERLLQPHGRASAQLLLLAQLRARGVPRVREPARQRRAREQPLALRAARAPDPHPRGRWLECPGSRCGRVPPVQTVSSCASREV